MKKRIIIAIIMVLFLIFIFSLKKGKDELKIKFLDEKEEELLKGSVYIDENLVGETSGFFDLPIEYCKDEHNIMLESEEAILEWGLFPKDCKLDQLVLKTSASKKISRKILFVFLEANTNKSISGGLFLNEEHVADITGNYSIKREDCRDIEEIRLVIDDGELIWQYDNSLCDKSEVIEFFS